MFSHHNIASMQLPLLLLCSHFQKTKCLRDLLVATPEHWHPPLRPLGLQAPNTGFKWLLKNFTESEFQPPLQMFGYWYKYVTNLHYCEVVQSNHIWKAMMTCSHGIIFWAVLSNMIALSVTVAMWSLVNHHNILPFWSPPPLLSPSVQVDNEAQI